MHHIRYSRGVSQKIFCKASYSCFTVYPEDLLSQTETSSDKTTSHQISTETGKLCRWGVPAWQEGNILKLDGLLLTLSIPKA